MILINEIFPDLQASDGKSCNHRSRKRSISAARRLKTRLRLTMTKERFYAKPQGEDWANFWSKWSTRKSWCCCAWLHFFCHWLLPRLLNNYKKKDRWVVTVLKNTELTSGQRFLKSTSPQPPPPKYTSKEVDRSPQFKNCSAGPVTNIELHR